MNINTLKYLVIFSLVIQSIQVDGQQFRSSYFLEDFSYSHNLNPAFMPESGYVGFPFFGHLGIGLQSNIGIENFLFPSENPQYALTTFMSSSVETDQFLGGLPQNNVMDMNFNMTPLSFGFYAWGGFNTFGMSINSNNMLNIPYELFNFLKHGTSNFDGTVYHIDNFRFRSNNYAELSLGHAREIDERLTLGAKVKTYLGAAALDANLYQLHISMSPERWDIYSDAEVSISADGVTPEYKDDDNDNSLVGFDLNTSGLGGTGFGIDLGATYEIMDGLSVSAAVLDIGFISWNSTVKTYAGDRFTFEGFDELSFTDEDNEDNPNSIENQVDNLTDDLMKLTNLYVSPDQSGTNKLMPVIMNLGAKYTMPFYDRLSVGLLSYTRFNDVYTWTEARLSANITPVDFFSFTTNYGISNYGSSLGWMLNLHPKGFNFYIGSDNMFTKVTPQFIPVRRMSTSIYLGLNITFGHQYR